MVKEFELKTNDGNEISSKLQIRQKKKNSIQASRGLDNNTIKIQAHSIMNPKQPLYWM